MSSTISAEVHMPDGTETSIPGKGSDPLEADFEKQLQDEGFELTGRKAPDTKPDAPAEKKPESTDKKPDEGTPPEKKEKPEDDGKKKEDEPKKGNEEWRSMIAKRRQEKARSGGEAKPAEAAKPEPSKPVEPEKKEPAATAVELTPEQQKFAEKYGIEPEDLPALFTPAKVEQVKAEGLSEDDRKLMDTIRTERDSLLIEKGFKDDFDTNVLPILKEEYPTISAAKVAEIRELIRQKLEFEQYGLTPLDVIYRGDKDFRGLVTQPKDGPDHGSRVPAKGNAGKVYDFENATEEDIKKSDFPFEEYSTYMANKERGNKRS